MSTLYDWRVVLQNLVTSNQVFRSDGFCLKRVKNIVAKPSRVQTWRCRGVDLDLEADTRLPTPTTLQCPLQGLYSEGALPLQGACRQRHMSRLHHQLSKADETRMAASKACWFAASMVDV